MANPTSSPAPSISRILHAGGLLALLGLLAIGGCKHNKPAPMQTIDYNRELPPGQLALQKISPANYPDFSLMQTDLAALEKAVDNSLAYLARPGSQRFYPYLDIDHDRAVATLTALRDIVARARTQPVDWNSEIRSRFEVYQSLGAPNAENTAYTGQVLFTGYFTPIYDASLTRQGPYQYPLYKRPANLSTPGGTPAGPASNGAAASNSNGAAASTPGGRYLTRAQIEANPSPLAGTELVWLKTRWEAYVITVQGSARLRLPDGQIFEIGYAGSNGYDYTSPGRQMLAEGVITRAQLTLHGLQAYFAAHPQDMDKYLPLNQRYIFFAQTQGGPFGSLNVPVTPLATIATDKEVYPRALPAFLNVPIPTAGGNVVPFHGFMLDQDTGGGIRAAGRCDIYMGVGPAAEQRAGRQLHPGALYYLAIKPELVRQYAPAPIQPLSQPSTPAPQLPNRVPSE